MSDHDMYIIDVILVFLVIILLIILCGGSGVL